MGRSSGFQYQPQRRPFEGEVDAWGLEPVGFPGRLDVEGAWPLRDRMVGSQLVDEVEEEDGQRASVRWGLWVWSKQTPQVMATRPEREACQKKSGG